METSLPVADRPRRPEWLKVRAPSPDSRYYDVKKLIHGQSLHTICEEARCPNIGECWGRGTATFQILGDTCTRACRYCYVHSGRPDSPPDPLEPLPARHPLRRLRGAVLTPHVGSAQARVRRQMADVLLSDLERFARGRPVRHRVTSSMLERMT